MKSPFPGMDPYLEQFWSDVHTRLMVYICDQIVDRLPSDLQARVEENLTVDEEDHSRSIRPDVSVVRSPADHGAVPPSVESIAIAEPRIIHAPYELVPDRHVEIFDPASGNRVVTVIEVLSPGNKDSQFRRGEYRRKQRDYLEGDVNLVEIDLIRTGEFVVAVPESLLGEEQRTPYIVCIRRMTNPVVAEVVDIDLRRPLPNIRLPLRPNDEDIVLELQPLIDLCYTRGRYSQRIDYSRPLSPSLQGEDAAWVAQLLHQP